MATPLSLDEIMSGRSESKGLGGPSSSITSTRSTSMSGRRQSSEDIVYAARRLSINKTLTSKNLGTTAEREEAAAAAEQATIKGDAAKAQRRRSSLLRMGLTDSVQRLLTKDLDMAVDEGALHGTPIEKLEKLLTAVKARGITAEKIFEYFSTNEEGSITPAEFETALRAISPGTFHMTSSDLEALLKEFDTKKTGNVEIPAFIDFCLSIRSLPWKAEKARRNSLRDGSGHGSQAELTTVPQMERRKSNTVKNIILGNKLYEGKKFFWRSKQNLDIVIHENSEEGIIIVSTRCFETGKTYPPLFLETSKMPYTKLDVVKAVDEKLLKRQESGQLDDLTDKERQAIVDATRRDMFVEFILNRLKVPDDANQSPGSAVAAPKGTTSSPQKTRGGSKATPPPNPTKRLSGSSGEAKTQGTASSALMDVNANNATMSDAPFMQKLSTDVAPTLLTKKSLCVENPYKFVACRRNSVEEFRRASIDFEKLAGETDNLLQVAKDKAGIAERQVVRARRLSVDPVTGLAPTDRWAEAKEDYPDDHGHYQSIAEDKDDDSSYRK